MTTEQQYQAEAAEGDVTIRVLNGPPTAPPLDSEPEGATAATATPAAPSHDVAPSVPGVITPELVQPLVEELFELRARRKGAHWRLAGDEASNIAEPLAGELDELLAHAPFLSGAAAAVGGRRLQLMMELVVAVCPRLYLDVQLARAEREQPRPDDTPPPVTGRQPIDLASRLSELPEDEGA